MKFLRLAIIILPWLSADTSKLVTEVNIQIISHRVVDLPNDNFPHRVPDPGQFAISDKRSKSLVLAGGRLGLS